MTELTAAELEGIVTLDPSTSADFALVNLIEKFRTLDQSEKKLASDKAEVRKAILAEITERGAQALEVHGSVVARKSQVTKTGLDSKTFKVTHPRLWAKFSKVTESVRLTIT